MYKIKDVYYIWLTKNWDTQCMLKSIGGPFGPYESRDTIKNLRSPIEGAGPPHQGGLVDTPDGNWYFMAFTDAYPIGRVPVLAPVVFDDEKWPIVKADYSKTRGQWLVEYPKAVADSGANGIDRSLRRYDFNTSHLSHEWEWNHNPDDSKWRLENGQLVLETGTITPSLHLATNTLTHRTTGPGGIATFCIDTSNMAVGDRAGVSMFRDESAYIAIHHDTAGAKLVFVDDIKVGPIGEQIGWLNGRPAALDWGVISNGFVRAEIPWKVGTVWLRIKVDMRASHADEHIDDVRVAAFEYSSDGTSFAQLGPAYNLTKSTAGFMGYRFGLFNFATVALGGDIRVKGCEIETCDPRG